MSHDSIALIEAQLENAWAWRQQRGILDESEALRVFHGPGEGEGELRQIAIDRFGDHYWVTQWRATSLLPRIARFLESKGARSAVALLRPEKGIPEDPVAILSTPPADAVSVREADGGRSLIRFTGTKHPGLFLDHAPLREWLRRRSRGWKVLNTFAYTGSLSVAAGRGGATDVTTLDLGKPAVRWARDNWELNGLPESGARWIAGDVFEWLPRLKREGQIYDCVILDPPSFSHGTKGRFSTAKDLEKLHALALQVLRPGGTLVTSINSANVSHLQYASDVRAAARKLSRSLSILSEINLPETFPTRLGASEDRYLKGWILRAGS